MEKPAASKDFSGEQKEEMSMASIMGVALMAVVIGAYEASGIKNH